MTPDEMLTYPPTKLELKNCLESIECTIAFDVRDWSEDRRLGWIYGIVFGWDLESEKELCTKFQWGNEDVTRLHTLHEQWEKLKKVIIE